MMRRSLGVAAFAVASAGLWLAAPVGAQAHPSIDIPLTTVERGAPGSEHLLATAEVPADAVGRECDVIVQGENNESVHPGNNLIVASGESYVELLDVEREAGAVTEAEGLLPLGEEITVTLVIGNDKVFSGGLTVTVDCPTPPPPTTGTTVTVPETTTTTAPAPPAPAPPAVPVPGTPTYTG